MLRGFRDRFPFWKAPQEPDQSEVVASCLDEPARGAPNSHLTTGREASEGELLILNERLQCHDLRLRHPRQHIWRIPVSVTVQSTRWVDTHVRSCEHDTDESSCTRSIAFTMYRAACMWPLSAMGIALMQHARLR